MSVMEIVIKVIVVAEAGIIVTMMMNRLRTTLHAGPALQAAPQNHQDRLALPREAATVHRADAEAGLIEVFYP